MTVDMSNIEIAADLLATRRIGTLATLLADAAAPTPYASLMPFVPDAAGRPLILISRLAVHTANILADPSVSLLIDGSEEFPDRLAGPRVTMVGSLTATDKAGNRELYLAAHPSAALYFDFPDFEMFCMTTHRIHLVAGFGKVQWLDVAQVIQLFCDRKNV